MTLSGGKDLIVNRCDNLTSGFLVNETYFIAFSHTYNSEVISFDAGVATHRNDGFTRIIYNPYRAVFLNMDCIFICTTTCSKAFREFFVVINRGYDLAAEVAGSYPPFTTNLESCPPA